MSAYLGGTSTNEAPVRKAVTLPALLAMRATGEKIAMLTCYDASFASLMDRCGVDILLIGDSLGMVCQGHDSTLPVTVADVAYHTASVVRGRKNAFVLADLPFGTYGTLQQAYDSCAALMRAGAQMIKIEGGEWLAETVRFLTERGIPVCAHIGLTPQFVHQLGGYRVQGKTDEGAEQLKRDALALQEAGAAMVLLEAVPAALGREVTGILQVPTIGIGAGPDCDGQVLVLHDLLGLNDRFKPKFLRRYAELAGDVRSAVGRFAEDVRGGRYPDTDHSF
jgi:3-methyl-2-oxobutanoate hydroxymethyltransferase